MNAKTRNDKAHAAGVATGLLGGGSLVLSSYLHQPEAHMKIMGRMRRVSANYGLRTARKGNKIMKGLKEAKDLPKAKYTKGVNKVSRMIERARKVDAFVNQYGKRPVYTQRLGKAVGLAGLGLTAGFAYKASQHLKGKK